jgi:hypothetical protein
LGSVRTDESSHLKQATEDFLTPGLDEDTIMDDDIFNADERRAE